MFCCNIKKASNITGTFAEFKSPDIVLSLIKVSISDYWSSKINFPKNGSEYSERPYFIYCTLYSLSFHRISLIFDITDQI